MIIITASDIIYYSKFDEEAFYEWISKLTFIEKIEEEYSNIYFFIDPKKISEDDLWDLIGFFHRYRIDKKQLAEFDKYVGGSWFRDPTKYWYMEIFG